MNWGKAIITAFIAFGSFIGFLVYRMTTAKVDLVRSDYYQTEIGYQKQIERIRHSRKASDPLKVRFEPAQQQVSFAVPASARGGEVRFFRPSDARLDFTVPVTPGMAPVPTVRLRKGYWKVQVTWTDGQQEYYSEEHLTL
jgi:nitrogen fixation protein FixH